MFAARTHTGEYIGFTTRGKIVEPYTTQDFRLASKSLTRRGAEQDIERFLENLNDEELINMGMPSVNSFEIVVVNMPKTVWERILTGLLDD